MRGIRVAWMAMCLSSCLLADWPGDPTFGDTGGTPLCENTCEYAGDSDCDDGGPNALTSLCALGTDCGDCGPR